MFKNASPVIALENVDRTPDRDVASSFEHRPASDQYHGRDHGNGES